MPREPGGVAVDGRPQVTARADRIRDLSSLPIWVAPMAGGPSTPALVAAAARAGGFGFLAGGYQQAAALRANMEAVRAMGAPAFGVNLFVPGAPAADPGAVASYVASLRHEAARSGAGSGAEPGSGYGAGSGAEPGSGAESAAGIEPGEPTWDDDGWADKISLLLEEPPAAVSFTFGCPPPDVAAEFRRRGTLVGITVTSAGEAALAAGAGADCLIVQGREAGAHSGTFTAAGRLTDLRPGLLGLLAEVAAVTELPLIGAGGLADSDGAGAAMAAGAAAVSLGTAFLRCPESGAHPLYKAALADPRRTATAITRAFSGRPARAIVNRFVLDHPDAPAGYPEINNATRPLRAAAAAAGDPDGMSLYAGQGFRAASDRPAAEIIDQLAAGVPR
jgi:nitronate monooxygenase